MPITTSIFTVDGMDMNRNLNTWALILAAGEGSRLSSLTTTQAGVSIPKQFCSLHGGPSLVHEAIRRAMSITSSKRICAVVVEHQRQWWHSSLWPLSEANVVVQPANKGTANGVLLPLLHILEQDPNANVVLLPSDHYVENESILTKSLNVALDQLEHHPDEVILLGIEPNEVDTELGYIVPQPRDSLAPPKVAQFVEKPSTNHARNLVEEGGLWNAFIVVARATSLLALFTKQMPNAVLQMQVALFRELHDKHALADLYRRLPTKDFSKDVLQGAENRLRVLQVPQCGWSDLGTPRRVIEALQKYPKTPREPKYSSGHLSLSAQRERLRYSVESEGLR